MFFFGIYSAKKKCAEKTFNILIQPNQPRCGLGSISLHLALVENFYYIQYFSTFKILLCFLFFLLLLTSDIRFSAVLITRQLVFFFFVVFVKIVRAKTPLLSHNQLTVAFICIHSNICFRFVHQANCNSSLCSFIAIICARLHF